MASLKPKQSNILGYNLFRITLIHISKYWPWQKIQIGALVQRRGGLTFFLKGGRALRTRWDPKSYWLIFCPWIRIRVFAYLCESGFESRKPKCCGSNKIWSGSKALVSITIKAAAWRGDLFSLSRYVPSWSSSSK